MAEAKDGCVKPAPGPIQAPDESGAASGKTEPKEERVMPRAEVGKEAPDFELSAYIDGGFKNIKLSDYRGQWVVVCFYPGDFTFV
jgi:hypothetical protein